MTTELSQADFAQAQRAWYRIWLPRVTIATLVLMAVGFGTQWVFTSTTDFLMTIILSFFIAFAMLPAVDYLSGRGWKRGVATGLVMVVGAGMAGIFTFAMAQLVVDQIVQLISNTPVYVPQAVDWVNSTFDQNYSVESVVAELGGVEEVATATASTLLSGALGFTSSVLGLVFRALTIGLFVFYILADFPRMRAALLHNLRPSSQLHVDTFLSITVQKVGGYIYSRLLLAAASAAFHYVIFLVLDLPYALAMALWVGLVSQFVPSVGTYIAGVVPVLIALMEEPSAAIWVIVAVTIYQQIENYLLSPKITANTMDLHPAVAFGSAMIGASLLGATGALLALPVAATITALVQTYADDYELVENEMMESPEHYAARMAEIREAKERRRKERIGKLKIKTKHHTDTPDDE
ncbi:MAG: AI-2E family transporter [Actinomycetota bacterium]|nr:AI-2E family transporter [Actinomycetota bacterium]